MKKIYIIWNRDFDIVNSKWRINNICETFTGARRLLKSFEEYGSRFLEYKITVDEVIDPNDTEEVEDDNKV